jgi:type IV pilus assembly protein PilV
MKSIRHNTARQQGFSLLEVMVSLVVASIALLGLAAGQIKSLQYATNSFDYTLSLLQAHNAVENTWANLCLVQKGDLAFADVNTDTQNEKYTISFPNNFDSDKFQVEVEWVDTRINDGLENSVLIEASFPNIAGSC